MNPQHKDYQVIPYPKYRRFMVAAFRSTRRKPIIHGLLEVDVTRARTILRAHKAIAGESLSFTAFLVGCLARAVEENKGVQAYRLGSKRLVVFDDVDVLTDVERHVADRSYVVPHVIRAANRKSFRELHEEIRATQAQDASDLLKTFRPMSLPPALFGPFMWVWDWAAKRRPRLWKRIVGTVEISSVGMFAAGAGWGVPPASASPLTITVGGIGERQVLVDGRVAVRESLSLTISVNHEIVDGGPAARFAQRLRELIESGYGLDDLTAAIEPEPASQRTPAATHPALP